LGPALIPVPWIFSVTNHLARTFYFVAFTAIRNVLIICHASAERFLVEITLIKLHVHFFFQNLNIYGDNGEIRFEEREVIWIYWLPNTY
jgi:hypothetical protein